MTDTFLTIVSKRDNRLYAARDLSSGDIRRILDAGRLSGSARNRQPWRFHIATSPETRAHLAPAVYVPTMVRTAPLAVALTAYTADSGLWGFDVGRAAQNMMLAAWDAGIVSCPNGVAVPDVLRSELDLGPDWAPVSVLTFGHPAVERPAGRRSPERWIERAPRRSRDDVEVWLDDPPSSE